MNFYETDIGQRFFTLHIPQLIEALQEIATALRQPVSIGRLLDFADQKNDILSEIYDFRYMPESQAYGEDNPLNGEVRKAMNALLETLSPEQKELFLQYEAAENARGGSISHCAYRDGARLAVQIILAGCTSPSLNPKPHQTTTQKNERSSPNDSSLFT